MPWSSPACTVSPVVLVIGGDRPDRLDHDLMGLKGIDEGDWRAVREPSAPVPVIAEYRRCAILFHFDVLSFWRARCGRWMTVMSSTVSSASLASSVFHNCSLAPLDPARVGSEDEFRAIASSGIIPEFERHECGQALPTAQTQIRW